MKETRMLDINNINCWVVNLKPTSNNLSEFQKKCIEKNVFGIGWWLEDFFRDGKTVYLKDYIQNSEYEDAYNKKADEPGNGWKHISKMALNNMNNIRINDIVIMRLRDAYYMGIVSQEAFYNDTVFDNSPDNKIMSWVCKVDQWYAEKNDEFLPSEIIGRLSNQRQPTISIVKNPRQKMLLAAAFNNTCERQIEGVSKINLSIDNFERSLNYMELEDIVCNYMYSDINKSFPDNRYILLPSSCKLTRPTFEFMFVCHGENPITCQVKNNASIDIKQHINDSYRKIYLFSGVGYNNLESRHDNIEIIDRVELFKYLTDCADYMHKKLSLYYAFDGTGVDL